MAEKRKRIRILTERNSRYLNRNRIHDPDLEVHGNLRNSYQELLQQFLH